MSHYISKKYKSSKLKKTRKTLDDFIDVNEDRLKGWYLNWAGFLNKKRNAGFAVLQIAFSYFEAVAIFKKGREAKRGESSKFFNEIFKEVFPELGQLYNSQDSEKIIGKIYSKGRCGCYHAGMAKREITLEDRIGLSSPIIKADFDGIGNVENVKIDRYGFVSSIMNHFDDYIQKLRNPSENY